MVPVVGLVQRDVVVRHERWRTPSYPKVLIRATHIVRASAQTNCPLTIVREECAAVVNGRHDDKQTI